MKSLLTLAALGWLGFAVAACASSTRSGPTTSGAIAPAATRSSAPPSSATVKDSNDLDDDAAGDDDRLVVAYGHNASPDEARAIEDAVRRYYAVAVRDNGTKACSMLASTAVEALVEESGDSTDPSARTCSAIVSKLLRLHHRQLVAALGTLKVTMVRVQAGIGLVVMRFATTPEPRKIPVRREAGVWKMKDVLDSGMP